MTKNPINKNIVVNIDKKTTSLNKNIQPLNKHISTTKTINTITNTFTTTTTTLTRPASKSILDIITTRTSGHFNNNEEDNNSYFSLHQSQHLLNGNLNTKPLVMTSQKMPTTKTVNDIFILEPDSVDYSDILNQLVMSTTTNILHNNNESNDYNYNINNLFNNSDTNFINDNNKISNNEDEPPFVSHATAIANIQSYIFIHSSLINLLFYYYTH